MDSLNEKAPTSHASTNTTYGVGTSANYGHTKLSDATDSTSDSLSGIAATPKAVSTGLDELMDNIIAAANNAGYGSSPNIVQQLHQKIDTKADKVDINGKGVVRSVNGTLADETGNVELGGGIPLGTLMPYTGKDVPAGFLRADGSTYTNMRSAFPEFYAWVVESGLTVSLGSYALVEGSCGYYGLDTSTGTVRMPTLAAGVFGTIAASQYGEAVQAGLPNLDTMFSGYGDPIGDSNYDKTTNSLITIVTGPSHPRGVGTRDATTSSYWRFNANAYNPIYGRSDTVQPPHVKYPWVVSVYNAAVAPSVSQANQFVGLLDGKADRSSVEAIKAYITETWSSGTSWYRKYSDSWIEQGGVLTNQSTTSASIVVTLHKEMANTNYSVRLDRKNPENTSVTNSQLASNSYTTTTFTIRSGLNGGHAENNCDIVWEVKGYAR
jgi:hypothetical protein